MSIQIPEHIKKVIIDGANIAFASRTKKNKPDFQNLVILQKELEDLKLVREDLEWFVICDANLRHAISEPKEYEKWIRKGIITQSPSRLKADIFILKMMHEFDGEIATISNDLFSEYADELDDVVHRCQLGFIIAFNQMFLEKLKIKTPKPAKIPHYEPVDLIIENLC
jgi:hypothetical protein